MADTDTVSNKMLSRGQLLIMYGFVSKEGKKFYDEHIKDTKSEKARRQAVSSLDKKK